jgi:hypothetical protein
MTLQRHISSFRFYEGTKDMTRVIRTSPQTGLLFLGGVTELHS